MKKQALIQCIFAGGVVFLAVGAYAVAYGAVGVMSQKAASLDTQIRTVSEDALRAGKARETLASLSMDEASVHAYLIRQEEIVPFLGRLEALASSLGSSLQVVSVSADTAGPRGKILISVKITGSFESVVRTLGAIEYGPYDSAIANVTLDTPENEPGQTPVWSAVAAFTLGTQQTNP